MLTTKKLSLLALLAVGAAAPATALADHDRGYRGDPRGRARARRPRYAGHPAAVGIRWLAI